MVYTQEGDNIRGGEGHRVERWSTKAASYNLGGTGQQRTKHGKGRRRTGRGERIEGSRGKRRERGTAGVRCRLIYLIAC